MQQTLKENIASINDSYTTYQTSATNYNKLVQAKNDIKAGTRDATDAEGDNGSKIVIPAPPCPPSQPPAFRKNKWVTGATAFDPVDATNGLGGSTG